jgi:hypothetical protein
MWLMHPFGMVLYCQVLLPLLLLSLLLMLSQDPVRLQLLRLLLLCLQPAVYPCQLLPGLQRVLLLLLLLPGLQMALLLLLLVVVLLLPGLQRAMLLLLLVRGAHCVRRLQCLPSSAPTAAGCCCHPGDAAASAMRATSTGLRLLTVARGCRLPHDHP